MLKRVIAEKALPFEPLIPNAETIEAIVGGEARKTRKDWLFRQYVSGFKCGRSSVA
jgi:antitoxin component of RelBE/YafQ-DinJ toxin-antitoxin module